MSIKNIYILFINMQLISSELYVLDVYLWILFLSF